MAIGVGGGAHILLAVHADSMHQVGVRPDVYLDRTRVLLDIIVEHGLLEIPGVVAAGDVDLIDLGQAVGRPTAGLHLDFNSSDKNPSLGMRFMRGRWLRIVVHM